eukprot:758204-Hanusia_phi.AAC.1
MDQQRRPLWFVPYSAEQVNKDFRRTRSTAPSETGKNLVPAQLRNYKTSKSTEKEWNTPAWRKGSITNPRNSAWLKACGEGNFYACKHISSFDDSIHDLLHPKHKYNFKAHKKGLVDNLQRHLNLSLERALSPVYVVQKPPSFFGTIMQDLGDRCPRQLRPPHTAMPQG